MYQKLGRQMEIMRCIHQYAAIYQPLKTEYIWVSLIIAMPQFVRPRHILMRQTVAIIVAKNAIPPDVSKEYAASIFLDIA